MAGLGVAASGSGSWLSPAMAEPPWAGYGIFLGLRFPVSKMGTIIVPTSLQDPRRLDKGTDTFHSHNRYAEGVSGDGEKCGQFRETLEEVHWAELGDALGVEGEGGVLRTILAPSLTAEKSGLWGGTHSLFRPSLLCTPGLSQTELWQSVPPNQLCAFTPVLPSASDVS